MITAIIISPILIFIAAGIARGFDQKWRILDRRGQLNTKWKKYAAANDLLMWASLPVMILLLYIFIKTTSPGVVEILALFLIVVKAYSIAGAAYWIVSEVSINVTGWGWKNAFRVGTDGSFPDNLGKWKWALEFGLLAVSVFFLFY